MSSIAPSQEPSHRRDFEESLTNPLLEEETQLDMCRGMRSMPILFFLCGVGSSLCYISILSSLVYFQSQYGDNSFLYLNLAVYLPLLPISIVQAKYDQPYDKQYGSANSFLFRGVLGYIICIGAMAAVPLRSGLVWVCLHSFLTGMAGAITQNLLFQMAAFVSSPTPAHPSGVNGLKPAVAAGIQGSALVSLGVSMIIGFGSPVDNSREHFVNFCIFICLIEAAILLLFLLLMKQSRMVVSMVRRDSYFVVNEEDGMEPGEAADAASSTDMGQDEKEGMEPGDAADTVSGADVGEREISRDNSGNSIELSYRRLWGHTSRICASLFLTLVPSFLVGSWFTMVKTDLVILPQILFYVKITADFLARLFAGWKAPSSARELLYSSALRILLVVAFFVNASSDAFPYRDVLSIALVAAIAFGSGYIVTGSFQLAPSQLPEEVREKNATKQAALLNLAFSFSALLGVLLSLVLVWLERVLAASTRY